MEKLITQEILDRDFAYFVENKILQRQHYKLKGIIGNVEDIEAELAEYGITLEDGINGVRWTRKEEEKWAHTPKSQRSPENRGSRNDSPLY